MTTRRRLAQYRLWMAHGVAPHLLSLLRSVSHTPTQCISVCGFSAVGKKTLIRKLVDGQLRDRFGIPSATMPEASVAAYGYSFQPLSDMFVARANYVVYQWQIATDGLIEDLRDRYPSSAHRVVVIWRPWEAHLRDWVKVYGNKTCGETTIAMITDWWTDVIVPRFQYQLPSVGVSVELVDGSTANYDRLEWRDVETFLDVETFSVGGGGPDARTGGGPENRRGGAGG